MQQRLADLQVGDAAVFERLPNQRHEFGILRAMTARS